MSIFQVTLGLLLLSVSAATSLAEERVRGSLDVLLTTPLSTRSILIGKWLGTFRQSARVLVWPAILAGLLVAGSGRLFHYLLLLGLILAYSAGIASLGLALATSSAHRKAAGIAMGVFRLRMDRHMQTAGDGSPRASSSLRSGTDQPPRARAVRRSAQQPAGTGRACEARPCASSWAGVP